MIELCVAFLFLNSMKTLNISVLWTKVSILMNHKTKGHVKKTLEKMDFCLIVCLLNTSLLWVYHKDMFLWMQSLLQPALLVTLPWSLFTFCPSYAKQVSCIVASKTVSLCKDSSQWSADQWSVGTDEVLFDVSWY